MAQEKKQDEMNDQNDDQNIENLDTGTGENNADAAAADTAAKDITNTDAALLVKLQDENAQLKDRLLRALAEAENVRKRAEKERSDTSKYAVSNFARQLLSVSDNLRRALEAISEDQRNENEALQSIYTGVEATERELLRAFESAGIKPIDPLDQPFNPNFHEVMFEADMPDKPTGTVFQVMEPGYMIHDRLLRPARVGVTKGGSKPSDSGDNIDQHV